MKIDPNHLEMLASVVRHGGLSEGAASLGKSQPSLSRTLANLEKRIGEPLFVRGKRPLQPTELGRLLAAQGQTILDASAIASTALTQYRQGRSGIVRVGGTPFFMDGVVSSKIADFQTQHPEVRIDQTYAYAADLTARLTSGTLDLALCPLAPDAVPEGCLFRPLMAGRNVIACRRGHPLTMKKSLARKDIGDFAWISPPADSPLFSDLKQVLASIGIADFKISFSGGSLNSVLNMTAGSDALTVLPHSVVFAMRTQFDLEALGIKIDHPRRDLGILTVEEVAITPAVRRFCAHVAKAFQSLEATMAHAEQKAIWRA